MGATQALLVLEDGTTAWGQSIGATGETFGEMVFNTGMSGYQEVLTDPSYKGQIVVMTYPEVGIYGVNPEDVESQQVQVAGYVVQRAVEGAFNHRATQSLRRYLLDQRIVALEGVDTRALTRRLRTAGAMRGAISTLDLDPAHLLARVRQSPGMLGRNLAGEVTVPEAIHYPAGSGLRIAVVDAGAKGNILRALQAQGAALTAFPYDTTLSELLAERFDGVLISNGPGDPEPLEPTIRLIRGLLEKSIPLAGICLGHQLLGLALGGATYKMRFGHRGANHPVKDLGSGRILITAQNHGFAVDPTSLGIDWAPLDIAFCPAQPALLRHRSVAAGETTMAELLPDAPLVGHSPLGFGAVEVSHLSLNDGTLEGLRLHDLPAFSVQFHPEASPGPHDAAAFFDAFTALIAGHTRAKEGAYA